MLNILFQLCLLVVLFILLLSSVRVIYGNIKYWNIIKSGTISDIEYIRGSRSDHEKGTYMNTIMTDITRETIYGGSQNQYIRGDEVKLRYRGLAGNIIFEVNGVKVRSKYDTWDWLSPIILFFTSLMLFKVIIIWFLPFIKNYSNE